MKIVCIGGGPDLCATSRRHLADNAWTFREVATLGYREIDWPAACRPCKESLERTGVRESV